MRTQPLPLDPFSPIRIGMAIWMTDVIVARKFVEAFTEPANWYSREPCRGSGPANVAGRHG